MDFFSASCIDINVKFVMENFLDDFGSDFKVRTFLSSEFWIDSLDLFSMSFKPTFSEMDGVFFITHDGMVTMLESEVAKLEKNLPIIVCFEGSRGWNIRRLLSWSLTSVNMWGGVAEDDGRRSISLRQQNMAIDIEIMIAAIQREFRHYVLFVFSLIRQDLLKHLESLRLLF